MNFALIKKKKSFKRERKVSSLPSWHLQAQASLPKPGFLIFSRVGRGGVRRESMVHEHMAWISLLSVAAMGWGLGSPQSELMACGPLVPGMTLPRVFNAILHGLSSISTAIHMSLQLSNAGGLVWEMEPWRGCVPSSNSLSAARAENPGASWGQAWKGTWRYSARQTGCMPTEQWPQKTHGSSTRLRIRSFQGFLGAPRTYPSYPCGCWNNWRPQQTSSLSLLEIPPRWLRSQSVLGPRSVVCSSWQGDSVCSPPPSHG